MQSCVGGFNERGTHIWSGQNVFVFFGFLLPAPTCQILSVPAQAKEVAAFTDKVSEKGKLSPQKDFGSP